MSINIKKPTIPILWLDTGFIWDRQDKIEFWKKLSSLVLQDKIIVVDTGQFAEMQERFSNTKSLPNEKQFQLFKFYKTIVGEHLAIDHSSFISNEIEVAMKAYILKSSDITYCYDELFDPLLNDMSELIDSSGITGWGTTRTFKKISSSIVFDWNILRKEAKNKNQSFLERHKQELMGFHDVIKLVSEGDDIKKKKNLVTHYLNEWRKISGDNELISMLDFFKSNYFFEIPYVNIHAKLISDLIIGNEEPRSSDYFDTTMISMILPFADYMIVDGSMKNRIVNKLKITKPIGLYPCKIIEHNKVDELLSFL